MAQWPDGIMCTLAMEHPHVGKKRNKHDYTHESGRIFQAWAYHD